MELMEGCPVSVLPDHRIDVVADGAFDVLKELLAKPEQLDSADSLCACLDRLLDGFVGLCDLLADLVAGPEQKPDCARDKGEYDSRHECQFRCQVKRQRNVYGRHEHRFQ